MAETKRVSDQYTIVAPSIVLTGNLTVTGSSTTINTTDSNIEDNTILINSGELGAGVTAGTAGINVDRGSQPDVGLRWNESTDKWQITNDGSTWGDIASSTASVPGSDKQVVYNNSGAFGAEAAFTYNYTTNTLLIDNVSIDGTNKTITSVGTNTTLTLAGTGTGYVKFNTATVLPEISTPTSSASSTVFYAATPGAGGAGLYFINSASVNDELISKKKAQAFALVF